ncbi:hypothetical protein PYW07_015925 [Mythimna separata]|uniref:Uncharacterized protein n=1 Tax=Mythimna separata TaxID=271217 RepID=A0AAD7YRC3_MYTSE|nr:hypothetical protein PYW07_015925 [Mythimna separata]
MDKETSERESHTEFDSVLYREVGQFGKYQLITISLLAFPSLICAFMAGDYIFTAGNLPTRCAVPECDGPNPEYSPDWILNAVPATTSGFDNCNRYVNATSATSHDGLCPASLFDRDVIVPCDTYVHERINTMVYDFNIECQEWLRALPGTLNSAGGMVALVLAGFISDRLGRRVSIVFFSFNVALVGVIRAFSVNFAMYTALQFMQTAIGGGAFSAAYIMAAEIVGPQYRVRTSATISSMFALGQVVLGILAFAVRPWRTLTLVLYVPVFLIISYYWILSESFRWLLSKNKQEDGKATLEYASRLNGKQISAKSMDFLLTAIQNQVQENKPVKEENLLLRVIKSPVLLRSVKVHWQNVIKNLEMSYKDEKFWESNSATVRELVGPVIFQRIAKIFNLAKEGNEYEPLDQYLTEIPSSDQHIAPSSAPRMGPNHLSNYTDFTMEEENDENVEEDSEWSNSTITPEKKRTTPSTRSINIPKSISKMLSKSFSRHLSMLMDTADNKSDHKSSDGRSFFSSVDSIATSSDDMDVRAGSISSRRHSLNPPEIINPFYDMLYCNKSETDMIKWNSKYKQKTFEVSASDEFSKRAEILTKKISNEFYDWWVGLGNVEFKSEIKRPEDIEALFQVWFDEHSSRGLVLDPQIIPCVLKSIAVNTGVPRASCIKALRRQIADDIKAETSPAHIRAFGTSLPHKLKHIPPQNNTYKQWRGVEIPEDLRTMACVWEDIQHLTSTKAFQHWLVKHPNLPMPPFLKTLDVVGDKKPLFVVPSDYIMKEKGGGSIASAPELALPVSQFSLELKDVLSRLMDT